MPMSCITPMAIRATKTTVMPSSLMLQVVIRVPPIKRLIRSATASEPKIIADSRMVKPLKSTPSPRVGKAEVKTQTVKGAIIVAGIARPVTMPGSSRTRIAKAAAELSGGAAEAKVSPVVNQLGRPTKRQMMKVIKGNIISTKNIAAEMNKGRFKTDNKFFGSILSIETNAISMEIGTTYGRTNSETFGNAKPIATPMTMKRGVLFDIMLNMLSIIVSFRKFDLGNHDKCYSSTICPDKLIGNWTN